MSGQLRVNEIYKSIQGESRWAGRLCTFIRLTGCQLNCSYCDTRYAKNEGAMMTADDILDRVALLGVPLVELTGGEPLLQSACFPLARKLLDRSYTVLCETSGSLPIDLLPEGVIRIMDLKCPSSGEVDSNDWTNISKLAERDEVKFVIGTRVDFEWANEVINRYQLVDHCEIAMSPVFGEIDPDKIVQWIMEENLPVRFQPQLHKYIWEPTAASV